MNKDIKNYSSFIKDKKAWGLFLAKGLPTQKQEEYKYLDLSFLDNRDLRPQDANLALKLNDVQELLFEDKDFYNLVFINGLFIESFSSIPESLKIERVLNTSNDKHALKNLNLSFNQDCIEFNFTENLEKPIAFVHINSAKDDKLEYRSVYTNYKIEVAKDINIEFLEKFINSEKNKIFNNNVFEIFLNENSTLNHYIHQLSDDNFQFNHYQIEVNKNSEYRGFLVNQKSKIARFDFEINLNDINAKAEIVGIYLAKKDQVLDHYIKTNHRSKKTFSNHYLKGVLDDESQGVFYASTIAQKDAKKIIANQLNKNILLSKKAKSFSKPELWIKTDDVKCSHGSTTGQLDKEALFYLQTRGFSEAQATKILLKAFIDEIFSKIDNSMIKTHFERVLI
ncbi:MAG: FeS cluster assembly protein SufD [Candidatus Anoxychlamydiales bacterium]|nr:FeS cluster assembly protein SufD [Candidatus Anoxychlamydiales bacterium]